MGRSFSHTLSTELAEGERWHDLVIALERRPGGSARGRRARLQTHAPSDGRFAVGDTTIETSRGRGAVVLFRRVGDGWEREREVGPPKPKVDFFGSRVALAGDAMVVGASKEQRWLFPDAALDGAQALRAAAKSTWALHPKWLVDAHRAKKRGSPLQLSVYPLG